MQRPDLRLFVACDVPAATRDELDERLPREAFPGARWIPPDKQHITLRFLGRTPEDRLPDLEAACAEAAEGQAPFTLGLGELGVFPTPKRARVLWVGLRDEARALTVAAERVDLFLEARGWPARVRAFAPHLTLARFKEPQRLTTLPPLPVSAPEPFEVDRLVLYRSILAPRGSRYEVLQGFPLA